MAGFERSRFGDGSAAGSGNVVTAVHTQYGPRTDKGPEGVVRTEGVKNQVSIEFTGSDIGKSTRFDRWLVAPTLPKGAVIKEAYVKVKEAFSLGGTTPTINLGTDTSEGTNGVEISEAQAEAIGTYDITSTIAGTWASPLAAAVNVDVALDGTSPTVTSAGRAEIVLVYVLV